jgi:hypothetical protein
MKTKEFKLCECNCGNYAKPGNRFINGHNRIGKKNIEAASRIGNKNPMFGRTGKNSPIFNRKHTKDELREMSESQKGEKGYWFGKKNFDHSVRMLGEKSPRFGKPGYWAGKKRPDISAKPSPMLGKKNPIVSILMKEKTGDKNNNWNGGSSFEPYSLEWTNELKNKIRERDHYICQLCKKYGNTIHHIDYNKKHCDFSNLINLCRSCNVKVNKNRIQWEIYFRLYMVINQKGERNESGTRSTKENS